MCANKEWQKEELGSVLSVSRVVLASEMDSERAVSVCGHGDVCKPVPTFCFSVRVHEFRAA